MNLSSSRIKTKEQQLLYRQSAYASSPIGDSSFVIEGSFYQESPVTLKDVLTRRINKSLCFCLIVAITVTFVSYYIAMNYEAKLNSLDNEIVRLNAENQDLQSELDRFKSFNNVDNKIGEFNLLQKADKVIEVTALNSAEKEVEDAVKAASNNFDWAIGY